MLSIPVKPIHRQEWVAALLCLICAWACYANSVGNGFCEDDLPIIVYDPLVTETGYGGRLWLTDYWHVKSTAIIHRDLLYRPVTILSYRINHLLGGLEPAGYHLVNIALHGLVTVLVFRLGRRLTGSTAAAMAAGLLFAVLPIHSEAVDNVVGRAELLAALFLLGAIELFAVRSMWGMVAGSVCAFAACASKESGLAVLLLIPLLDDPLRRNRLRYLGLVLAALTYLSLRYAALGGALYQAGPVTKSVNVLVDAEAWERICGALQLWGMYWTKTVWPAVLCLDYSIHAVSPATNLFAGQALLGLIVLAVMSGAALWTWRRGAALPSKLMLGLLICYFPVSNTLVLVNTYFAERLWYLPSIWVALLAGLIVARLVGAASWRRYVLAGLMVLVVTAAWGRCWRRNAEWRDPQTVYAAAYRDHPQAVQVLLGYGQVLVGVGQTDRGINLLEEALLIDLGLVDAHRSLGSAYLQAGQADKALQHLQLANVQAPGHGPTQQRLEQARQWVGRQSADVLSQAEAAVAANPDDLDAMIDLADRLAEVGRLDDALAVLRERANQFGTSARFHHRLAIALVMTNRQDEGVDAYGRAVELDQGNAPLKAELAMLLLDRRTAGDLDRAGMLSEAAWRLERTSIPVGLCRAEVLALNGKPSEAAALYRSIAASLPPGSDLRRMCELKLAGLGQR